MSHFIDYDIVSKYGPEIIPYLNTFHAVIMSGNYDVLMDPSKFVRFMQSFNGNLETWKLSILLISEKHESNLLRLNCLNTILEVVN